MYDSRARVQRLWAASLLSASLASATCFAGDYQVQPGDSLWAVARKHGVSVGSIQQANKLTKDQIRPGQRLTIPSASKTTAQRSASASKPALQSAAIPRQAAVHPAAPAPSTHHAPTARSATRSSLAAAEKLYQRSGEPAPSTLEEQAPAWVLQPPSSAPSSSQPRAENPSSARLGALPLGVTPCAAPDPGFKAYSKWVQVAPMAHVLAPKQASLEADGAFDVLVHFHGREPIRKEWVQVVSRAVLVAVDVGIDSNAYAEAFQDPRTLGQVLRAVEAELKQRTGQSNAHVRRLALSAWSAGYGAVEQILSQPLGKSQVDAVILLDGLHAGYLGQSLDSERLAPFVQFAQAAAASQRFFFVSHSSIPTTGYASSTETARYLAWKVGGKPRATEPLASDPMGLARFAAFSLGDFHTRGFYGSGAADHCAQLALMRDVLRVHLLPRWQRQPEGADRVVESAPRELLPQPEKS